MDGKNEMDIGTRFVLVANGKRYLYEIVDRSENDGFDPTLEETVDNCKLFCSGYQCCMCVDYESSENLYSCDLPDGMRCVGGLKCLGVVNEQGFLPSWWNPSLYPDIEDQMGDDGVESSRMFIATCEDEHHTQIASGGTLDELISHWNGGRV